MKNNLIELITEVFLFLQGKRKAIDINNIKAIASGYAAASLRVQKLENTRSYLWANKTHPAKVMVVPMKKYGKVAIGLN